MQTRDQMPRVWKTRVTVKHHCVPVDFGEHITRSAETLDGTAVGGGQVVVAAARGPRSGKMDSNSPHCPSRSSADNLGKQPACTEDQKDPKTLPTSCATSSATEDRTPSPVVVEASGNCPSCSMEDISASKTEGGVLVKKEETVPSTSQERCNGEAAAVTSSSQKSSELCTPGPISCGGGGGGGVVVVEPCGVEHLAELRVPSPHPVSGLTLPAPGEDLASDVSSETSATTNSSQGTKRSHEEMEMAEGGVSPVKQKNKKRCFRCSIKLELAQRECGRCRCGGVFCSAHRHPEAHNCQFDHKEDGRREAREKMVKPTRHFGPSFRRLEQS
ncbi:hypothetical protein ACOMHN_051487 [Nucella lapillus]